jgi:hypothetical protein
VFWGCWRNVITPDLFLLREDDVWQVVLVGRAVDSGGDIGDIVLADSAVIKLAVTRRIVLVLYRSWL